MSTLKIKNDGVWEPILAIKGEKGDTGKNFTILGKYATLLALQTAHPTGSAGDAWSVGDTVSSDLYIWDTVSLAWVNICQLGTNRNASSIMLEDTANHYTSTNLEDALAEVSVRTNAKEPTFTKNTAFNKNFGTTAGTVAQGNDSRFTDARTPLAHAHVISDITGLQTALNDKVLSITDFGAVGDGVTINNTAIQNAIDYAVANDIGTVRIPFGTFRLTAPIIIQRVVNLVGDGCEPYKTMGTPHTRGDGSWLHFDHTGKGLHIVSTVDTASGIQLRNFGTLRTQTIPTTGTYVPAYDNDFDVYIDDADVTIVDLTLLNPTRGITVNNGSFGRIIIDRLKMHPLLEGIYVAESYDTCRINNVQIWPFWAFNDSLWQYNISNTVGIQLGRCDNPFLSNIFTYLCKIGLHIVNNALLGTTNKLHLSGADFDNGNFGIVIAGTGFTGQFSNVTIQSEYQILATLGLSGFGIYVANASNNVVDFTNVEIKYARASGIRVWGTGNDFSFTNLRINSYNRINNKANSAIELDNGNVATLSGVFKVTDGGNATNIIGLNGTIKADLGGGTVMQQTDAGGYVTVTHGLGMTPRSIMLTVFNTGSLTSVQADSENVNATSFRVRMFDAAGAPRASVTIGFYWKAYL